MHSFFTHACLRSAVFVAGSVLGAAALGGFDASLSIHAGDAAGEPVPAADDSLRIQIEPLIWFVGPSGKMKLPVASGTGPGGFTSEAEKVRINDIGLASTRVRPAGTLVATTGPWRFTFGGSDFELSRGSAAADVAGRLGSVAFAQGDPLNVDMSLGMYEFSAGYRVWEHDWRAGSGSPDAAVDAFVYVHAFVGGRFYDVGVSVESASGAPARAEESNLFFEPFVGARAEAVLADDFSVVLQLSAGGMALYSTLSYSLDVVIAFEWRPVSNVGIELGWRQIAFNLTDGRDLERFQYTGRLAGLFAGVVIRF